MLYFRRSARVARRDQLRETALLSIVWLFTAMLVDFVGFVAIKNPWSLTPHQFYLDKYQPWITLDYVAIFASPWLRLLLTGNNSTSPESNRAVTSRQAQ